ncbi:MAG: hypothetical protein AAF355_03450 [Myxococcota bacterium]
MIQDLIPDGHETELYEQIWQEKEVEDLRHGVATDDDARARAEAFLSSRRRLTRIDRVDCSFLRWHDA